MESITNRLYQVGKEYQGLKTRTRKYYIQKAIQKRE
jgi:hypothetical protein